MSSLSKPTDSYREHLELWEQSRAAIGGKSEVMKIITCLPGPQYKKYPTYSGMTPEQYNHANRCNTVNALRVESYWARGRYFPATGRTFESLGGMIWSKEPEQELSSRLMYLEGNADGSGCGIREVAQKTTDEVLYTGTYAILVDMPSNDTAPTMAQMEDPSNAPKWIQYKAEQIIYIRSNGMSKALDEVRLVEIKSEKKNEFDYEDKKYTRRLVMLDGVYHNQLFNEDDQMVNDVVPRANGAALNEIPIQFFGADDNSSAYSKPPLIDLANVNLGHFVLDCDNRDNLHFHGQGMTNVFVDDGETFQENNPNGLDVGAKGRNQFGVNDRVEILQLDATGAIPSEMLRDEQRMVMAGAQLVTNNSSTETLGAKRIDTNANTSALKRMSFNISDGFKQLLAWTSMFLGVTEESTYKLNTDFVTDDLTPEMIKTHFELVQGGVLPQVTLNETARKAKLTDMTNEDIETELSNQNLLDGSTEEVATLQAQLDAAKEEISQLRASE